ncbi:MAG: sulfite oxidase heme-binding subunit YedZ [Burkholderiales bacterium]
MRREAWLKPVVFGVCLLPLAMLVWRAATVGLGADPIEEVTEATGRWTLNLLLITLAVTPLRRLSGWQWMGRLRRMLGLFAFFHAVLHFTIFLVFEHFFDWDEILRDIVKRPYVTVGFTAFVLLIPLALTSTNGMLRRLGGARWRRMRWLVYLIGVLGVLHFIWLVKADLRDPILYAVVLSLLLALRLPWPAAWSRPARREVSPSCAE